MGHSDRVRPARFIPPSAEMQAMFAEAEAKRLAERDAAYHPALSRVWRIIADKDGGADRGGSSFWIYVPRGANPGREHVLERDHFLGLEVSPPDAEEITSLLAQLG